MTIFCIALFCVPILLHRASGPEIFQDTDTKAILSGIEQREQEHASVLQWFSQDWPLKNHFYRPITTLTFELDRALYGTNPAGFGLTNALILCACLFALGWLAKEVSDSRTLTGAVVCVAALWTLGWSSFLAIPAFILGAVSLVVSLLPGRDWRRGIVSSLLWCFVGFESSGISQLDQRMISWLPGRTASTMALFALISLASMARFAIQTSPLAPDPAPSPFELPPSKTYESPKRKGIEPTIYLTLSLAAFALALGSYEQAVMIPALHGLILWFRRKQGHIASYWPLVGSFAILGIYLVVRQSVLPPGISSYQQQQFWSSMGVVLALSDYVLPSFASLRMSWLSVTTTPSVLLFASPWVAMLGLASDVIGYVRVLSNGPGATLFLLGSIVAFLPMAWFKPFEHYHYFPMMLRAGMFVLVIELAAMALISAASRRAIQAPSRSDLE